MGKDIGKMRHRILVCTLIGSRIGERPVRTCRMPWPDRAGFARRIITHGNNNIHMGCIWPRILIPRLGTQVLHLNSRGRQGSERIWIGGAGRKTSRTEGLKAVAPTSVKIGFREQTACGIPGTKKQHVQQQPVPTQLAPKSEPAAPLEAAAETSRSARLYPRSSVW